MLLGQRKRWQLAAAACLLAAGCSATTPGKPEAPPPPPATRALVTWAELMCSTTDGLDKVRADGTTADYTSGVNAQFYVQRTATSIENGKKTLKNLEPSKIAEADAYVAALLKTLDALPLPSSDSMTTQNLPDDQQIAQAKQVAAIVGPLGKPKADLTEMVGKTPALLTSYNLAPSCAGPPGTPQRALVGWANTMCASVKAVDGLRVDQPISDDPRFAQFLNVELAHAIGDATTKVDSVAQPLAALAPTGIAEADAFKTELVTALEAAKGQLPKTTMMTGHDMPIAELKNQVAKASDVLDSVKPKAQGLPALAARLPQLTPSYDLAPLCTPLNAPPPTPKPLPAARNGTDVKACESGNCQVLVTGTVEFSVSGRKLKVVVSDQGVAISDDISLLHLGDGGEGSSGNAGKMAHFHIAGFVPPSAVLDISTTA
ncbi:hypothetical protein AB5J62_22195 [Amycolatopsis sp. cg5]|uniref:hypothetical protein n=1 Tax=Amycolatopsis sp. cg5 TaxID=3238802 RepID=UPI00352352F8